VHDFCAGRQFEPLHNENNRIEGVIVRDKESLSVGVEAFATRCEADVFKITVRICNRTSFEVPAEKTRDQALMHSLLSVHTVLGAGNCKFVSLLDPPENLRELASSCQNIGTWPVLIGAEGSHDTVLSSPIILYDYPRIAPESAGDLFDGLEIDEILSLRIMTMTDEEKREMRESDDRARQVLERIEALPQEQLMKMHGVLRNLRPLDKEVS
jgi:hydrogenase maturation protease